MLVKQSSIKNFYDFETLSLFPYEKDLINKSLLNLNQVNWINNYHQLVYKKLSPFLENSHKTWLLKKTKKILKSD
ncbi:MAG: M24 family metallopeptidase C-terminal domain-containing protein [Pseudomonadota bacterium]|nr:M24 family metallopeptidase C-terminal domain-containing protein [Pseudomonadota bacterium]